MEPSKISVVDDSSHRSRTPVSRFLRRIPAEGWLTLLALIIWATVQGDYGITWDETEESNYGEAVRKYIFSNESFADFSHQGGLTVNAHYYGPALGLFCAMISHASGWDIFTVRHAIQGLLWVAMIYPASRLGRRIAGPAGAWCAGLALLGMPTLLGQAFNNSKDMPLACAALWMLHVCVATASVRRLTWRQALNLGFAMGFVLTMRSGAWFVCVLPGLVLLGGIWRAYRLSGKIEWLRVPVRTLPILLAAAVIGWILMILPWPDAWHSPVKFPFVANRYAMHFNEVYMVLFQGNIFPSNKLPWDYLGGYILLTVPVPLLALGIWGHMTLWRRSCRSIPAAMATLGIVYLLWAPLIGFMVLRPNIYDGMRHFLFVLPPLAVVAGVAAASLIRQLRTAPQWLVITGTVAVLLSAGPAMMRLHPYQNVYFNFLAGPRETLHERFETDYWLSSYQDAARWINETQSHSKKQLSVGVAANILCDACLRHYVNPPTKVTDFGFGWFPGKLPAEYDYYVTTPSLGQSVNFPDTPIAHTVTRDGIVLAIIKGNPQP